MHTTMNIRMKMINRFLDEAFFLRMYFSINSFANVKYLQGTVANIVFRFRKHITFPRAIQSTLLIFTLIYALFQFT